MNLRDRIGISERTQRRAVRGMQMVLFALVVVGIDRGSPGVTVNSAVALLVTYLPGVLERDYDLQLDPGLTLWITAAAFFHAVGVGGVPGVDVNLYRTTSWWDHFTHALSSSVVAGVGYTVVRALDEHSEAIAIPNRLTIVFVLIFVAAFGVVWEVIEFALGGLSGVFGGPTLLTQYGLEDTMLDLFFDLLGGLIVGVVGTARLTGVAADVSERLAARREA